MSLIIFVWISLDKIFWSLHDVLHGVMVSKLDKQTITSEFKSHTSGFMPQLSNFFSFYDELTNYRLKKDTRNIFFFLILIIYIHTDTHKYITYT